MPSNPPPAWYPDPAEASGYRYWDGEHWTELRVPGSAPLAQSQQPQPRPTSQRWNTPETWAALATIFVLFPVTTRAVTAADQAGVSAWVVVAGAAVIALTAAVLLESDTGKAKDGVLFGLYLTSTVAGIYATARALDVWEVLVMVVVVVPVLTVQWLRKKARVGPHREERSA